MRTVPLSSMKFLTLTFQLKFKKMAKIAIKSNARVREIFEDLEKLQNFCVRYGYKFNEADLNNFKSYAWQQYSKFVSGKNAKNMWDEDSRRFANYRMK